MSMKNNLWKVSVLPNATAATPCHTVLVRATSKDEAIKQALEHAKDNAVLHADPRVQECHGATAEEVRELQDHETIRVLNYCELERDA